MSVLCTSLLLISIPDDCTVCITFCWSLSSARPGGTALNPREEADVCSTVKSKCCTFRGEVCRYDLDSLNVQLAPSDDGQEVVMATTRFLSSFFSTFYGNTFRLTISVIFMTQQIIINTYGYTDTYTHACNNNGAKKRSWSWWKVEKIYRRAWEGRENVLIKIFTILNKNAFLTPLLQGHRHRVIVWHVTLHSARS